MDRTLGAICGALLFALLCNAGFCYEASMFDIDTDGWQVADLRTSGPYDPPLDYYSVNHSLTGGYPGGCIWAHDPTSNSYSLQAPAKFTGDKSAYYGGVLRFAMKCTHSNWTSDNVVVLVGTNGKIITSQILPIPPTAWQVYTIVLKEANFRYNNKSGAVVSAADMTAVLGSIKALRILAEYGSQVQETAYLDSVELSTPRDVGTSNFSLTQTAAVAAGSRYRFVTCGKVTRIDTNYFTLNDGSPDPIKVHAPGYTGIVNGDTARAAGFLDSAASPRVLRCLAADVKKLN